MVGQLPNTVDPSGMNPQFMIFANSAPCIQQSSYTAVDRVAAGSEKQNRERRYGVKLESEDEVDEVVVDWNEPREGFH